MSGAPGIVATSDVVAAPDVVAVVVSFRTRDRTLECVESLLADADSFDGSARVAVVDNASGDGSAAALRERFGDRIELIASDVNLGYGAALNRGAATAPDARHVLVLNADTTVRTGLLTALSRELDAAPEVGIAAPALVDDLGEHQPSVRGHPSPLALMHQHTALRFLRVGSAAYRAYKRPPGAAQPIDASTRLDADVLMGAALMVRGDLFRELGGFDSRYFLYFEEADLCRRVTEGGARVRLVGAATVQHAGGGSADHHRERALLWYLGSLFQYVDRFRGRAFGLTYRAVFKPLFIVRMFTDAIRDSLHVICRPDRRAEKCAELALGARFFTRGIWRFLVL